MLMVCWRHGCAAQDCRAIILILTLLRYHEAAVFVNTQHQTYPHFGQRINNNKKMTHPLKTHKLLDELLEEVKTQLVQQQIVLQRV